MKKRHFFLMIACCTIPIIGLALVYLFKLPLNTVLLGAMVLICPLSMFLMMIIMGQEHGATHSTDDPGMAIKDVVIPRHEGE